VSSISSDARSIVTRYDRNADGQIDLTQRGPEAEHRRLALRSDRFGTSQDVVTYPTLFRDADADQNGRVTTAELEAVMRRFDSDGDGELKGSWESWGQAFRALLQGRQMDGDRYVAQYTEQEDPTARVRVTTTGETTVSIEDV
jgi:hypothetical protein